ncbi:ATP-dependent helicase [Glaciibacter superstes]|uniref:ATP-dependent helicase n=1 Tax=Glaciibacter superstes TaxID=501023 RepID=UPI0003B52996|nr:ATP-dependent DNA helicase [Glaciibacter superstes]
MTRQPADIVDVPLFDGREFEEPVVSNNPVENNPVENNPVENNPVDKHPLDDAQRAVLRIPNGSSAAVIGAPGTGKTTTLIELVADRVLRRGYSPSDLLVIAPTRTGATTLRDRIAVRLGVPTSGPLARTANSIAFQIVRDAAVQGGDSSPTLLTGGEQDQIVTDLLQGHLEEGMGPTWPEHLGPEVRGLRGFRTELRDLMMRAVEYGVSSERLAALGREHDRDEWVAAAEFIRDYEDVKDQSREGQFDSTELAVYAAAIVRAAPGGGGGGATPAGPVGAGHLTSVSAATGLLGTGLLGTGPLGSLGDLRLIVLEDAQEATQATLTLLAQFAARGVAVIAFGDPDISTGSFRGAHPDALGRLGWYLGVAGVATHILGTVHRHGHAIRAVVQEATNRIGAASAGRQRAASLSNASSGHAEASGLATAMVAPSPADQLAIIARRLRERHVLGGIPWDRMAVIVRSGSLVPSISKGLAALEVPTQVATIQSALRDEPAVAAFILALDVVFARRPLDGETANALLAGPLGGLDPITLRRLRAALRQQELSGEGDRGADELLVEALTVPGALATIDTRTARRAAAFGDSLRAASVDQRDGATIEELLWGLWERSGLAASWYEQSNGAGIVADEANRNLDAVVALFSAAQRFVERTPGAPPVLFLEHLVDTDVPEDTLAPRALGDAVTVSTTSGTIGQEFEIVVIAGVQDNVWPDLRIRGSLLGAGDLAALVTGGNPDTEDARTAVLHDELRMFAQAASRASAELLVTTVSNEDNQPSVFLRLLPESQTEIADRYPLSLRGMTGRLRRDLTASQQSPERVKDAPATLARLAREKVAGADPAEWYGLREASTTLRLNEPDAGDGPVRVSPSKMASFETCPLHWLIDTLGGGTSNSAANLGTIIHTVMEEATSAENADLDVVSADALWRGVEARWGELVFESEWQSQVQKNDARRLTDRLASYLADFERAGSTLLSAEGHFELAIGESGHGAAVLSGTVDRVEKLADGRAVIVDLKTGKSDPKTDDGVVDHPQLGAYQLAFHDGAIDGIPPGSELAGARLVIVSSGTAKKNYRDPTQQAFSPEELDSFRRRVADDAGGMGGSTFIAEIADHCLDPWSFGSCRIHVIRQVSS